MASNEAALNQSHGACRSNKKHRFNDMGFSFHPQSSIPPFPSNPGPNPNHNPFSTDPSQHASTIHQFLANRDAFHLLWRQLDDALTARERLVLMKEEEVRRKERAFRGQERFIEAMKDEVVHWKAEASYYKNQFLSLKNRAEDQINANAKPRGESGLVRENSGSQMCTRKDNADVNRYRDQNAEGVFMEKSSHFDKCFASGDRKDCDCSLSSLEIVEKCHTTKTSASKCFDGSIADANGASSCSNAQAVSSSGNFQCSNKDMTGDSPSMELQEGNCVGSSQMPKPSVAIAPINDEVTVNSNNHIVDAAMSIFPGKMKIEHIEGASIVALDSGLDSLRKNISLQPELGSSLVNEEVDASSNDRILGTDLPIFPVNVKTEPIESVPIVSTGNGLDRSVIQASPVGCIKNENFDDADMDELDHVSLHERTKLLLSSNFSPVSISSDCGGLHGRNWSLEYESSDLLNHKARDFNIERRKKRTPTSSVEIALEEDAPGLLQILLERGLQLDEIKLYSCVENEDRLETCPDGDSFAELETVISKLFSHREMLLKLAKTFHRKGSKVGYCLPYLISLIEQTRYLQLHKWLVEWGWCRDLYSFIFVFERHNRIVLERPEYGYATYFFELVPSLPIDWQIKRLIYAMKLTSCSRSTLLENRALVVGEDLTEDEAHILEDYGWRPNSGLGSMLNYCDRVVHDYKTEDTSEWKSKIGKLLMNGYDQGTISLPNIPKKVLALKTEVLTLETGLSSQVQS